MNIHLRYAPTDLELELLGIDISARWPTSAYSLLWNVTQSPSQSGIWALWFGDISFARRERGICAGVVMPRHDLWSRTNCSVVTLSFSQFRIVALSMLPPFGPEQPTTKSNENRDNFFIPGNCNINKKKETRDKRYF